ncbi:MAG: hypothetical protein HYY45_20950 [Deltaproteobacteria bacterium]|nr:hypothetical protein [Deltaproteobacteria bacterium]
MRNLSHPRLLAFAYLLFAIICLSLFGCSTPSWYFGVGGKYNEAKTELMRPRGADLNRAILSLESIVRENPTYRDSLTLLGMAYYHKARNEDAFQIITRALAINREDEIAWLLLGLLQLRLGDHERGLESIKGGLTLMGRAMRDDSGYRGYSKWDPSGSVRLSLRRAVFSATKGLEERENLVRATEALFRAIFNEEWFQVNRDRAIERRDTDLGN